VWATVSRRLRYRGTASNQLWLGHRVAAINLQRLINLGLTRGPDGWAIPDHQATITPGPSRRFTLFRRLRPRQSEQGETPGPADTSETSCSAGS